MKQPVARPTKPKPKSKPVTTIREPRAFVPDLQEEPIASFEEASLPEVTPTPRPKRRGWLWRILLGAGGLLVSLGLALAAEQLITNLFARYDWLGWVGLGALALLLMAVVLLAAREVIAIMRLKSLTALHDRAELALKEDDAKAARQLVGELQALYAPHADMARPRTELDKNMDGLFDGADMVRTAERTLMAPLDARAKTLTAASSRRVAIVTAISPRAFVDIAFVAYESFKLARAIAELYGARPGLIGSWRLGGAVLSHLAVTGGVALGDSVIQQLVGHGLAAKLSARLGEGVVNGLMTVRVGIAAMRVTRPLPFEALKQPLVMDFMADLANITKNEPPTAS